MFITSLGSEKCCTYYDGDNYDYYYDDCLSNCDSALYQSGSLMCCESTIKDIATSVIIFIVVSLAIILIALIVTICCCIHGRKRRRQL